MRPPYRLLEKEQNRGLSGVVTPPHPGIGSPTKLEDGSAPPVEPVGDVDGPRQKSERERGLRQCRSTSMVSLWRGRRWCRSIASTLSRSHLPLCRLQVRPRELESPGVLHKELDEVCQEVSSPWTVCSRPQPACMYDVEGILKGVPTQTVRGEMVKPRPVITNWSVAGEAPHQLCREAVGSPNRLQDVTPLQMGGPDNSPRPLTELDEPMANVLGGEGEVPPLPQYLRVASELRSHVPHRPSRCSACLNLNRSGEHVYQGVHIQPHLLIDIVEDNAGFHLAMYLWPDVPHISKK